MSDKPKRNTEIGEIVVECTSRNGDCAREPDGTKCKCAYLDFFCIPLRAQGRQPSDLDLTDPPRFTEAQRAFWKAWYELGARTVKWNDSKCVYDIIKVSGGKLVEIFGTITMLSGSEIGLRAGETLDLAELFGKEGK